MHPRPLVPPKAISAIVLVEEASSRIQYLEHKTEEDRQAQNMVFLAWASKTPECPVHIVYF